MQLLILLAVCCAVACASNAHDATDKAYSPRYTLLAESKRKDQDMGPASTDVAASEQQPWRRLAYAGFGGQPSNWLGSGTGGALAAPIGPGLMLLGLNLGALLCMLLGLLGLGPSYRVGPWHTGDIYRSDRHNLGGDKESTLYF